MGSGYARQLRVRYGADLYHLSREAWKLIPLVIKLLELTKNFSVVTKDAVTYKIIAAGPILGPRVGNVLKGKGVVVFAL